jgi:hypothetical protein
MAKKKPTPLHPFQPVYLERDGTLRFKENKIVSYLLKHGGIDLNKIAELPFEREDRVHFAQLIGYSVGGFGELNYVKDDEYEKARLMADDEDPRDAELAVLRETLYAIRKGLREPIAELYGKHPDDLMEDGE